MDLDPGPGVHNVTSAGLDDIFLACYSPSGSFLWGFGIGGPSYDAVWQMAIDDNNNVIIGGWVQSGGIDFDPGAGVFILPYAGGTGMTYYGDGFIAKYSSTGAFQWAYNMGGITVYDHLDAIATDHAGNVYMTGEADGTFTVGPYTFTSTVNGQAYIAKISPAGTFMWGHSFGLPGFAASDCNPFALAVSNGYIYMSGIFQATSTFDPWGVPAWLTSVGYYDGFFEKLDTNGNFVFVKQIIGSGVLDEPLGMTLDSLDNMYIIGVTNSATMTFDPASPGTSTFTAPGGGSNDDIFMVKYDSVGAYKWGTILGGPGDDIGWAMDIIGGYLYCTGQFQSTVDMDPGPGIANLTSTGSDDIYITKYDLNGNYVCGFSVGSPTTSDIGYGLAHDDSGHLYASGQFGGTAVDFDPGPGVTALTSIGGTDAYLVKYSYTGGSTITGHVIGDTICSGQTAYLTLVITSGGPGPFTITYTDGTTTYTHTGIMSGVPFTLAVNPVVTTTYSILTILAAGASICDVPSGAGLGSATVLVHPRPAITIADSFISCNEVKFTANTGDSIYNWSFGDGTNAAGNPVIHIYSVTGNEQVILTETSKFNCTAADTINVSVNNAPPLNLGNDTVICSGNSCTLSAPGTYTIPSYLWSTGSTAPTITVTTSGIYWLTIISNGCTVSDTIKVTFSLPPIVHLGNDTSVCAGVNFTLHASSQDGATYLWNTGSRDSTIIVTGSGTYTLTETLNGCSASASIQVAIIDKPAPFTLGPDTMLCKGEELVLSVSGQNVTWNSGYTAKTLTVIDSGTYWAAISNQCGTTVDTINVDIAPCDIWFPSAFTPNGDGLNDIIRVVGHLKFYKDFSLSIYNRWGQRVFYTENIYAGWDGIFNGVPQELGTYFYLIYYNLEGKNHMLKGDIELIR